MSNYQYLDKVNFPSDIKKLSIEELKIFSTEVRKELINAQQDFQNIGSGAILMNVENGEILSLVSLPDYDLNQRVSINDNIYTNKITLGVYELGSVFKTFTIAAGLENKVINSGRVLIRASGTENLIRLLIEHQDLNEINKLEKYFCDNIQKT